MKQNHTATMRKLVEQSMRKNSVGILEQARLTHQDLFGAYGAPAEGDAGTLLEMADVTTATGGVLNKVFGRSMWAQLNAQSQLYASLPKVQIGKGKPYGWRAKTAFASTGKGGTSEGTIPTAVTSTYAEVAPTMKEHATQMRVSGLHQDLADGPDDAYGALVDITAELAIEHAKEFERALCGDIDTAAGMNLESIDRVTASSANQATIGWTAGDEDIYGIDRSANTWANAEQVVAATAETFSTKMWDDLIRNVRKNGGMPTFIATGWETWAHVSEIVEPRGRFEVGVAPQAQAGVGGAVVPDGLTYSAFVGNYQGLPIVPTDQAVADANELPRSYILDISNPEGYDKPRLGLDVLRPTQMYLAGERSGTTPQSIGFIGDSVLAVTRHELGCRFFKAQAQRRDYTS